MTAPEFNAARTALAWSDDQLAQLLGVTGADVHGWATGAVPVPRRHARQLAWHLAALERHTALEAAGLPRCAWADAHWQTTPADVHGLERHQRAADAHAAVCETCLGNQRYEAEHFEPPPLPPQPAWMHVIQWILRVPSWALPALLGGVVLMGIVSLRVLVRLPAIFAAPDKLGEALVAITAAGGAGAAGGFAYSLTRPWLRRQGRPGAYLTGIVCVTAYLGALGLVAPIAFGESFFEEPADLVILAVVSVFFGLVMGHTWFRDRDAM